VVSIKAPGRGSTLIFGVVAKPLVPCHLTTTSRRPPLKLSPRTLQLATYGLIRLFRGRQMLSAIARLCYFGGLDLRYRRTRSSIINELRTGRLEGPIGLCQLLMHVYECWPKMYIRRSFTLLLRRFPECSVSCCLTVCRRNCALVNALAQNRP
jgi:hypothetical protein